MTLSKLIAEKAEGIRQVGARALEEARRAGVPAYYMDRSLGDGVIREMPDGTRERIQRHEGEEVVVESYGRKF
ncbi:hypothetical protein [Methylobacterium flocculans]|jgi:hypothetical protein|uniref:hypothetical protein n=1 Tax=Methylobacterium flocculans TaxID=2984843 RepID=UPI0021F263B0|nr:hypothetical protein [Methylobacterium sp. FF17]